MSLIQISEPGKSPAPHAKDKLSLGIDFGTSNCVCSIKIDNKIKFAKDEYNKQLIPSIINFVEDKIFIGNQKHETINHKIDKSILSVKRLFNDEPQKKIFLKNVNKSYSPIELASKIFSYLKKISLQTFKMNIDNCVITVPAYFDDIARSAIKKSAELSGFNVLRLINEPTSAAYAYGLEKKKRGNYFVYDLGGGTFDVSILKLNDGIFQVIGTGGDPRFGGDDIDSILGDYLLKRYFNLKLEQIEESESTKFFKFVKKVKENFSRKELFKKSVTFFKIKKTISMSKKEFNEVVSFQIKKTIDICKNALKDSKLTLNELDGFILVGGSSRISLISDMIRDVFNLKIYSEIDPDLVVSKGAALHSYGLLNGSDNLLLDIIPLSLGIETAGGLMEKIIQRNSPIPISKEQEFTTYEDGQTSIKIHIIQGEREIITDNRSLGEFILDGILPKPPGIPRIKVKFTVDANGILNVTASESDTNRIKELEIRPFSNLDIDQMKNMIKESVENAREDIEKRNLYELKIEGQRLLNQLDSLNDELNNLCSEYELEEISGLILNLKKAINDENADEIKILIDKLDTSTQSFSEKRIKSSLKSGLVGNKYDNL